MLRIAIRVDHWQHVSSCLVSSFLEAGNQALYLPLICKAIQPQTTVEPGEAPGVGSSLIAIAGFLVACQWRVWIIWRGCPVQFDLARSEMAGAYLGAMQSNPASKRRVHLDIASWMLGLAGKLFTALGIRCKQGMIFRDWIEQVQEGVPRSTILGNLASPGTETEPTDPPVEYSEAWLNCCRAQLDFNLLKKPYWRACPLWCLCQSSRVMTTHAV